MDAVSYIVASTGALSDTTLDCFVEAQAHDPLNFKDLTEVLLDRCGEPGTEFFLATVLATAVIRLAGVRS